MEGKAAHIRGPCFFLDVFNVHVTTLVANAHRNYWEVNNVTWYGTSDATVLSQQRASSFGSGGPSAFVSLRYFLIA